MTTHRRSNRVSFEEQQEARVRLMEERVAAGLSPTTGEPVSKADNVDFLAGSRRSEAQRRKQV